MSKLVHCAICRNEFVAKTNGRYCSEKCKKESAVVNYAKLLKKKECKKCGSLFLGTTKREVCDKCKAEKRLCKYEQIEIIHTCKHCGAEVNKEIKNKTKSMESNVRLDRVCLSCKRETQKRSAERMKKNNPMFSPKTRAKTASTLMGKEVNIEDYLKIRTSVKKFTKEEFSLLRREKMTGSSNPMKRQDVRDKVSKTWKQKIESGELVFKRGPEHHLWKGNRDRCFSIRTRLHPLWVVPILIRDEHVCRICGKKDRSLEVHHVSKTFIDIVNTILNGRKLFDLNDQDFEKLTIDVINEHKNVSGITCCALCHKKIDPRRRGGISNESQESDQKTI